MAVVGRLSGPGWLRYPDPATELDVIRLTDPAFSSGTTASHLRQFTRRGIGCSTGATATRLNSVGARQAFLLDLKKGGSKQLTEAAALDPASLSLSATSATFSFSTALH